MGKYRKFDGFTLMKFPNWTPSIPPGKRVLVVGASGGIGIALVKMLVKQKGLYIGAHFATNDKELKNITYRNIKLFQKNINSGNDCGFLVQEFCNWRNGIDMIIISIGGVSNPVHWNDLSPEDWENDIFVNLSAPFFLARTAMEEMKKEGRGGRVIIFGTESALHGGGADSFPYGVAKMGCECLVKGLAREGAKYSILVNLARLGYIKTPFHKRWKKLNKKDLKNREQLIPLKRGGEPEEAAALLVYLLSDWAQFITGQSFALTGGDWL